MSSPHYPDQSAGPCPVSGRALDACGTCVCISRTVPLPYRDERPCLDCDGRGWVETHICRDEKECARLGPSCPRREACFGCLGSGVKHGA